MCTNPLSRDCMHALIWTCAVHVGGSAVCWIEMFAWAGSRWYSYHMFCTCTCRFGIAVHTCTCTCTRLTYTCTCTCTCTCTRLHTYTCAYTCTYLCTVTFWEGWPLDCWLIDLSFIKLKLYHWLGWKHSWAVVREASRSGNTASRFESWVQHAEGRVRKDQRRLKKDENRDLSAEGGDHNAGGRCQGA